MNKKPIVLVVEDERINRLILKKILSSSYAILEAENGQEAWEILSSQNNMISAVLLDIVMPVMDGYELLKKISDAKLQELPVIVTTGESDMRTEQKVLDAGAWDFVTKPYNAKVLMSRLNNAIARSQITAYEQIQHLSEHDALTGLHNRGKMFADTKRMLEEHKGTHFAFLRVDIDHFALFNSSFGEAEGDKLLCFFAKMIREAAQNYRYCTYGRMNADVFCICIPYSGNYEALQANVKKAEKMLTEYKKDYQMKLSVGVYDIDDSKLSVEEFYIRASMGAQKCKNQYSKNIGFYDDSFGERAAAELAITNEMQTALDEQQFVVYFQPKVNLATDQACGAEALVRWIHPIKGLVSPGKFIPVFEKNGFIGQLDYYVWERTCQNLREWIDLGKNPYPVSVNISRISLYNPQLVKLLTELIERYKIAPSLLQLEVTESAYMTSPDLMQKTIHSLHESGFTILMDDFGSGYSSLNTLKSIEVDILKIDMKFLPVENEMEKGEIILVSIIRMANWLGMSVVVEGVETRRQRDFLEGVGCDYVQGYYYSRPIPKTEYEERYVFPEEANQRQMDQAVKEITPKYNLTILVIDDDEGDRVILNEYFKEQYHIQQCDSAEEGLAYLSQNHSKVRLILIDNVMEGMSGLEFLRYCQSEKTLRAIPQIMITANENVQDQVEAFQTGAYDYITKPLVEEIVKARVKHVMEISNQMHTYESAENSYQHQVEQDAMTGVLNKIAFRKISGHLMESDPEDQKALLVIDVDDFKGINDQYGHLVGDEMIKTIADTLRSTFRKTDIIGRFGGDEFLVLLNGLPNSDRAKRKAEDVIKAVVFAGVEQKHIKISVSVGIAFYEENDTIDTLFARADQALYEAKSTGRGKVVIYGEIVPQIMDDDKPVVLICGEDPQLYPAIALAYGNGAAFANTTSFEELKENFEKYKNRICTICLDTQKSMMEDSDAFYQYILEQEGAERIPIIAVCKEGDMENLKDALSLKIYDVITLPPQMDAIQRRLGRAIMKGRVGSDWNTAEIKK